MTERFIVFCGKNIKPWIYTDEPADRDATVDLIASGEALDLVKVIAFDVSAGTCRDATQEIATEVMTRWAHDGEPLSYQQYEFVEQTVGTRAARSFLRVA